MFIVREIKCRITQYREKILQRIEYHFTYIIYLHTGLEIRIQFMVFDNNVQRVNQKSIWTTNYMET